MLGSKMNDTPEGSVYDKVLRQSMTLKSLRVLRLCPVDQYFTASKAQLHGSTLKALAVKGYLNLELTIDGLGFEYYLNNHGHRMRRINVADFMNAPAKVEIKST